MQNESIMDSLKLVYPKLVPGGVAVIDDYGWDYLVGVKRACDHFFADKLEKVRPLAVIRPFFQGYFIKGA
jgi:hypothetical protein